MHLQDLIEVTVRKVDLLLMKPIKYMLTAELLKCNVTLTFTGKQPARSQDDRSRVAVLVCAATLRMLVQLTHASQFYNESHRN